jgi:hypothetical protein
MLPPRAGCSTTDLAASALDGFPSGSPHSKSVAMRWHHCKQPGSGSDSRSRRIPCWRTFACCSQMARKFADQRFTALFSNGSGGLILSISSRSFPAFGRYSIGVIGHLQTIVSDSRKPAASRTTPNWSTKSHESSELADRRMAQLNSPEYRGCTRCGTNCREYQVEHPRWNFRPSTASGFNASVATLYGQPFIETLASSPVFEFIAEGSAVIVLSCRLTPKWASASLRASWSRTNNSVRPLPRSCSIKAFGWPCVAWGGLTRP